MCIRDSLRAGFRNRYLIDAAQKVYSGEVALESCRTIDYEQARKELSLIHILALSSMLERTLPLWSRPLLYERSFDVFPLLKRSVKRKKTDALSQEKLSLLYVVEAESFTVVSTVAALATVENAKVVLDITAVSYTHLLCARPCTEKCVACACPSIYIRS